jgi:molybdopterin molybdotransferase
MRPFTQTLPLDEALARLAAVVTSVDGVERVGLHKALGRVVAAPARATRDVPPFDRSAMDGYAVVAADIAGASHGSPVDLPLAGVVFTGDAPGLALARGTCVEIATGAPVPVGTDAVVMVEETSRHGTTVTFRREATKGLHITPHGSDLRSGEAALVAGDAVTPARLGALAAIGLAEVDVYRKPRVAIASTGNELVEPGQPAGPGQIYDINRHTLEALVTRHGGIAEIHRAISDDLDGLRGAVDAMRDADLIVLSGGSSVGERDLVVDLVRERGEVIFHGIAVKPGKPTLLATLGRQLLLGMPGNPTSCLSNGYILLVPLLRQMARLPPWRPERVRAPLAATIVSGAGRHQFYSVRLEAGRVHRAFKGSGEITSLSRADGYIEIPANVDRVEEGAEVVVTLF